MFWGRGWLVWGDSRLRVGGSCGRPCRVVHRRGPPPVAKSSARGVPRLRAQADEPQDHRDVARAPTQGAGDARRPGLAQDADGQVAQRRHDLGSRAPTDLGAVFVEDAVPHVVHAVFDRPVLADELQHGGRIGAGGVEAGGPEDDFVAGPSTPQRRAVQTRRGAIDAEDLPDMREVEVAVQFSAGADLPRLQAAVGLVRRLVHRGGRPPNGGRGCHRGASAGCP